MRRALSGVALLVALPGVMAAQKNQCSPMQPRLAAALESGLAAYRQGRFSAADSAFSGVLTVCPSHPGALIAAGYAELRLDRLATARGAALPGKHPSDRFVVASYDPTAPAAPGDLLPRGRISGQFGAAPLWTWATWDMPRWHAEVKPLFAAMQRAFAAIPDRGALARAP